MLKCRLPSPTWPNGSSRPSGHQPGDQRHAALDQLGDAADRDRDVVADDLALLAHGRAQLLAHPPQHGALRLAGGQRRVEHQPRLERVGEPRLGGGREAVGQRPGELGQHVPGRRRLQRVAHALQMRRPPPRRSRAAISSKLEISSAKRSLPWVSSETAASGDGTAANSGHALARPGEQAQGGGGDDRRGCPRRPGRPASGRSRYCPCAACAGRSRPGRRPAPPRGPSTSSRAMP